MQKTIKMTYLTFKLCLCHQSREFKSKKSNFKLAVTYWERDRVPRVFLARSATHYRLRDPQVFLAREVTW